MYAAGQTKTVAKTILNTSERIDLKVWVHRSDGSKVDVTTQVVLANYDTNIIDIDKSNSANYQIVAGNNGGVLKDTWYSFNGIIWYKGTDFPDFSGGEFV